MRPKPFALALVLSAGFAASGATAETGSVQADFLFIGSYHMDNPGRDAHDTQADDVLSARRQREIAEVVGLIERFRPTADSIDYLKAVERHHQQRQYEEHLAIGKAESERGQKLLDQGTVLSMLQHLNSDEWLAQNARAYFRIGMLGTQTDPIGANWVQLWFGRNLAIFNNIARRTGKGDRILVLYGAGHGNYLRQLATDSGLYRVHDPMAFLSVPPGGN